MHHEFSTATEPGYVTRSEGGVDRITFPYPLIAEAAERIGVFYVIGLVKDQRVRVAQVSQSQAGGEQGNPSRASPPPPFGSVGCHAAPCPAHRLIVASRAMGQTGRVLILAATPIGNLGDVTDRLRQALGQVAAVAAEDTRSAQRLLAALKISHRPRLYALHDHNERQRAAELIELARDTDVLVISDAGMPTVSDPGYLLVAEAAANDVPVSVLPGPSAVLAALAVSGLATDRFCFDGFVPRKDGDRAALWLQLQHETRTIVLFESPHRLADTLASAAASLGSNRRAVVCRELTKLHEEVRRGNLSELAAWAAQGVRGEIVLVLAGAEPSRIGLSEATAEVQRLVDAGAGLKAAAAEVAAQTGLRPRELYQAALEGRPSLPAP